MDSTFNRLGSKYYGIDINNLRAFCERCSFYPTTAQTDAILRRFDHNGNGRLDWAEYYELVTGTEYVENAVMEEDSAEDKEKAVEVEEDSAEDKEKAVEVEEVKVREPEAV